MSTRTHRNPTTITLFAVGLAAALAKGQQRVDPVERFAWGENVGFINFAGAGDPPGSAELVVFNDHLAGFAWAENIGWINLGRAPGPYTNSDASNFGVNVDPATRALSGFAWSENAGWINFAAGSFADPPRPARIENARLRGFAWGENIGWISFDDDALAVRLECPPDLAPPVGVLDFFDVLAWLALFEVFDPASDLGPPSGVFDIFDLLAYLDLFAAGC